MADDQGGATGGPGPNPWQQSQEPGPQGPPAAPDSEPTTWPSPAAPTGPSGPYQGPTPTPAYPQPFQYPHQPPRKSRTGLIVGLILGAAVLLIAVPVVAGLAVGLVSASSGPSPGGQAPPVEATPDVLPGSPPPTPPTPPPPTPTPTPTTESVTLRIPGSVSGYDRMTGSSAKRTVKELRRDMSKGSSSYKDGFEKSKIALYAKGSNRLIFIGFSASDSPLIASDLSASASRQVDSFLSGGGIDDPKDYPAGSRGGFLRCGSTRQSNVDVAVCAWADSSALITVQASGTTPKKLSAVLRAFRDASIRKGGPLLPA